MLLITRAPFVAPAAAVVPLSCTVPLPTMKFPVKSFALLMVNVLLPSLMMLAAPLILPAPLMV